MGLASRDGGWVQVGEVFVGSGEVECGWLSPMGLGSLHGLEWGCLGILF